MNGFESRANSDKLKEFQAESRVSKVCKVKG